MISFGGCGTLTDPSTSRKKYCKFVTNTVFIHNEGLFAVLMVATHTFQLKPISWLLCSAKFLYDALGNKVLSRSSADASRQCCLCSLSFTPLPGVKVAQW